MKKVNSDLLRILRHDMCFTNKLLSIYKEASKLNAVPSLDDCKTELKQLALSDDRIKHSAFDQSFLTELYICACKLNAENLIKNQMRAKNERKFLQELQKLEVSVARHKPVLYSKLKRAVQRDDYGAIKSDGRISVLHEFFESQKIAHEPQSKEDIEVFHRLIRHCEEIMSEYERQMNYSLDKGLAELTKSGQSFEVWVEETLSFLGWSVRATKTTGDQGVDLIAERNTIRVAIQCKAYVGAVGNKAVQEVVAGMRHYDLDRAAVISTGTYTRSAVSLAKSNHVTLLMPEDLPILYDLLSSENLGVESIK